MSAQNIPTHGGNDAEFFTIGTNTFLAVANAHSNNTEVYMWSNTGLLFEPFQSLQSFFCIGATYFEVAAWRLRSRLTAADCGLIVPHAGIADFARERAVGVE